MQKVEAVGIPPIEPFDVLVVGGGPAGSTIATLLARRGERVLLIEKDRHPQFHIDESLRPMNMPLFDELEVGDEIARIGIPKCGVEFVSPYHDKPSTLDFCPRMGQALRFGLRSSTVGV